MAAGVAWAARSLSSLGSVRQTLSNFPYWPRPRECPARALRNGSIRPLFTETSQVTSSRPRYDILFCGSDAFSVASLKALVGSKDVWRNLTVLVPHERAVRIKGVNTLIPCLLSEFAKSNNLPVEQVPSDGIGKYQMPEAFNQPSPTSLLVTASFGHILPNDFLAHFLAAHRLNVHPSLLPRWRGAAPIQWTIANGDKKTGVSVQRLVPKGQGIDSGGLVGQARNCPVPDNATYETLLPTLADVGGELLLDVISEMQKGEVQARIQHDSLVTRAPKIKEETASISFAEKTSTQLLRLSRGISHQYPLWTTLDGQKIQLTAIGPAKPPDWSPVILSGVVPGRAALNKKARILRVACAPEAGNEVTWLSVFKVKPGGRKEMPVHEWWNGLSKAMRSAKYITLGT